MSSDIYPRPKLAVQDSQTGSFCGERPGAIGEPFGEGLIEVIGHTALQLELLVGLEADLRADTPKIVIGLR